MPKMGQEHQIDLTDEQVRYDFREDISVILEPWFRRRTLADIAAKLTNNGVLWDTFQTFSQMMEEDPRFSEDNPVFEGLDQPGIGHYLAARSPLDFSAQERLPVRPAPVLGQHTNEILSEVLGLPDHDIGKLHDRGVVSDAA